MHHITKVGRKKRFTTHIGPPPSLNDPLKWFNYADSDNKGNISQEQAISGMCGTVRASSDQRIFIRDKIQGSWSKFDRNHDMLVNQSEFTHTKTGMWQFLRRLEKEVSQVPRSKKPPTKTRSAAKRHKREGNYPALYKGIEWFKHCDTSHNNSLSKEEVIHGIIELLKVQSSVEQDVICDTIENAWYAFDIDNSGEIDKHEFLCDGGLQAYLILFQSEWMKRPNDRSTNNFLNLYVKGGCRHNYLPPPPLSANPEKWFNHVDYDRSKELSQKELVNGLIVSLNANTSEKRRKIRELIIEVWHKYDLNFDNGICKEDFLTEDGLANMLINLEEDWKRDNGSSPEEESQTLNIKVNIPRSMEAGDIMQICSPKSQEMVVIQIPDKIVWNGGGKEPYYIIVSF